MRKNRTMFLTLGYLACVLSITACLSSAVFANKENSVDSSTKLAQFKVSSASLRSDGKWLSVITKSNGKNLSPQLSWAPVKGAFCYAIYMFDTSAGNWLHWIAKDVTQTDLKLGADIKNSKYIGPYPPSGTHTYEIIVFALKAIPDSYSGTFDKTNSNLKTIYAALDKSNGNTGNIIAKGSLSGVYTKGDTVQ